jgi:hypothetical protein
MHNDFVARAVMPAGKPRLPRPPRSGMVARLFALTHFFKKTALC